MKRYRVTHRTVYAYDAPVTDSYGLTWTLPRATGWQSVADARVSIEPVPADTSCSTDYYGNHVRYFQVTTPHRELTVEAGSDVEVAAPEPVAEDLRRPWELCRPLAAEDPDAWRIVDFCLPSPLVEHTEAAHRYAAASLRAGRPVGEAVTELAGRLHRDLVYRPGATTVSSTVDEVLAARAGVCQDFAHVLLACLRTYGVAARYVSGYLATTPPPGATRLVGADASHAWVAVWLGGDRWLAVDPTNDTWADDRYVTVAWGRDYADVPPVKGTIFTTATSSTLDVQVDVVPR